MLSASYIKGDHFDLQVCSTKKLYFIAIAEIQFHNFKKLVAKYEIQFQFAIDFVHLKSTYFQFHEIGNLQVVFCNWLKFAILHDILQL